MASFTSSRLRKEVLVPVYLRLLNDKIRWVMKLCGFSQIKLFFQVASMAAQELGRFISTFADHTFTGLSVQNGKVRVKLQDFVMLTVLGCRSTFH